MAHTVLCPHRNSSNVKTILSLVNDPQSFLVPELSGTVRTWVSCLNCNVFFSSPRLSSAQLDRMYQKYRLVEFRGETEGEYFDRITNYKPNESENFLKVEFMQAFVVNPNTVLDIGSGGGVLIHSMKTVWPTALFFGVEPSPNYCNLAERRTGAVIINGFYSEKNFLNQSFDLITCCQVFEHVDDLKAFVAAVHLNMHTKSYFYVEVPDASDFSALPLTHSRFTEPSHLWYFNEAFLRKFFSKEGFMVIASKSEKTIRGRNNLTFILMLERSS